LNKSPTSENLILVVDDEEQVLNTLKRQMRHHSANIVYFSSPIKALEFIKNNKVACVVSDQRMSVLLGTDLLKQVAKIQPNSFRVIVSAYSDFDEVIQSFNDQILHQFMDKPWNKKMIMELFDQFCYEDDKTSNTSFLGMETQSNVMQQLFKQIKKFSHANVPIFIDGETGTGKELVAKALHKLGQRKNKKFIAVNCANFSSTLLESQLFGYKKGAFTSADSHSEGLLKELDGGTLFLDEITSLPIELQAKLLRVLQEREFMPLGSTETICFDIQIISASSMSMSRAQEAGTFRSDLRYRLEVLPLFVPPLMDRKGDASYLFRLLLKNMIPNKNYQLDDDLIRFLDSYSWPGNVRQLQNVLTYTAHTTEETHLQTKHLPLDVFENTNDKANDKMMLNSKDILSNKSKLQDLLECENNNKSRAATKLGISRMTLYRHLKKFGL